MAAEAVVQYHKQVNNRAVDRAQLYADPFAARASRDGKSARTTGASLLVHVLSGHHHRRKCSCACVRGIVPNLPYPEVRYGRSRVPVGGANRGSRQTICPGARICQCSLTSPRSGGFASPARQHYVVVAGFVQFLQPLVAWDK